MTLDEYLFRHKLQQQDFAAQIEASNSMVSFIRSGTRRPSIELAQRIEKATDGKVSALELLGLETPKAKKARHK